MVAASGPAPVRQGRPDEVAKTTTAAATENIQHGNVELIAESNTCD